MSTETRTDPPLEDILQNSQDRAYKEVFQRQNTLNRQELRKLDEVHRNRGPNQQRIWNSITAQLNNGELEFGPCPRIKKGESSLSTQQTQKLNEALEKYYQKTKEYTSEDLEDHLTNQQICGRDVDETHEVRIHGNKLRLGYNNEDHELVVQFPNDQNPSSDELKNEIQNNIIDYDAYSHTKEQGNCLKIDLKESSGIYLLDEENKPIKEIISPKEEEKMPEQKKSALAILDGEGWTKLDPPKQGDDDSVVGYHDGQPVKRPPIKKESTEEYTSYKSGNFDLKVKNNSLEVKVVKLDTTQKYSEDDKPRTKIKKDKADQYRVTIPASVVRELGLKRWQRIRYEPSIGELDGDTKFVVDMELIGDVHETSFQGHDVRLAVDKHYDEFKLDINIVGDDYKEGHLEVEIYPTPDHYDTDFTINGIPVQWDENGKTKYRPTEEIHEISVGFEDFETEHSIRIDWDKSNQKAKLTVEKTYIVWKIDNYRGNRGYLDILNDKNALIFGANVQKEGNGTTKQVDYPVIDGEPLGAIELPEDVYLNLHTDVEVWNDIDDPGSIKSIWKYGEEESATGYVANPPKNLIEVTEAEGKQMTWEIVDEDKMKGYIDIPTENKID